MICPQCGADTEGTVTDAGCVSSTCVACNVKVTGQGHSPLADQADAEGRMIAWPANEPLTIAPRLAKRRRGQV